MTATAKPWEPVSYRWSKLGGTLVDVELWFDITQEEVPRVIDAINTRDHATFKLADNSLVIVKPKGREL